MAFNSCERSNICLHYLSNSSSLYLENIRWFLIPAVLFAFVWSFLEKRKSFKTNILGGRPALYRILNLLDGGVRDRWGTSFILGAMVTLVYSLTLRTLVSSDFPLWATVLMVYVQALEASFLTLPLFSCLSTRFRLLGGVIGLVYALGWSAFSLYNFVVPVKCIVEAKRCTQNEKTVEEIFDVAGALSVLIDLPAQICLMCIVVKFISRIYYCIKAGEYLREEKSDLSVHNNEIYVKYILDPTGTKATQRVRNKYLERIVYNIPGFTYSNPIFSTAFMMAIVLYQVILTAEYLVDVVQKLLRISWKWIYLEEKLEQTGILYIIQGCGIASGIATGIYGFSVIYGLLMTYKRHMLMLYKGERQFLPKGADKQKAEIHLVRSTMYMGYQIIGMMYGIVFCFVCIFTPLTLLCIVFKVVESLGLVQQLLKQFQLLVYPISVFIIFRLQILIVGKFLLQEKLNTTDQQRPLAINNRKAHDLFKFFMLFVNLSIGSIFFLIRLLRHIFLGVFLVPRMDRCMFPRGFEKGDTSHMSYIGMLMVDYTHNNPIMRVFCSILLKNTQRLNNQRSNEHSVDENATYVELEEQVFPRQYQGISRARTKWLVAYTLLKNPSLVALRKNALPDIVLMEASDLPEGVIHRVQQSVTTTLFIYIGMLAILMAIAFLFFGIKAILS